MAYVQKTLTNFFTTKNKKKNNVENDVKHVIDGIISSVEQNVEKLKKKNDMDYTKSKEKVQQWKKDFSFWETKTGKVINQ